MEAIRIRNVVSEVVGRDKPLPSKVLIKKIRPVSAPRVRMALHEPWQVKGWRVKRDQLRGYYRISKKRKWTGYVVDPFGRNPEFFIINPPSELFDSEHGACFMREKRNHFFVHFAEKPQNLIDGIFQIEDSLRESFK